MQEPLFLIYKSTIQVKITHSTGLQIRVRIGKIFSLFLSQNIVVGTQKNRLNKGSLLSTQNTCLNWWIRKFSQIYAHKISLFGSLSQAPLDSQQRHLKETFSYLRHYPKSYMLVSIWEMNSIFGMFMESWIVRVSCKVNVRPFFGLNVKFARDPKKGFTLTFQETRSIHNSINIPKNEFIA